MGEILAIGSVLFVISVILPIYLVIALGNVKKRLEALEAVTARRPYLGMPESPPREKPVTAPKPVETPAEDFTPPKQATPAPRPASAWNPAPKVNRQPARKSFVFNAGKIDQFSKWAQENWVFILAGVSLALAGVFLVQYGVENGLLSPTMRVLAAIGFGLVLVGAGEFIRRKTAGDEVGSFALLPSVFAGAGLVAIFAGVLSARMLYGLIGSEMAFAGLTLTGALAILLGWVYRPYLAALGVFGALIAPFLVSSGSSNAGPLHLYFALIAGVALAIDAYKRWAWLSALALVGAFLASWTLLAARDTGFYAVLFAFITALLAVGLPVLSLTPRHRGARLFGFLTQRLKSAGMEFPTRVAGGAFVAASLYLGWVYMGEAGLFWLVLMVLGLLLLMAIFWMKDAPALADLAFVPPVIALLVIAYEAIEGRAVAAAWVADAMRDQLDYPSSTVALLLGGALAGSLSFAWRSYVGQPLRVANAVMAAGFAPWVAIAIELRWAPSYVLGAGQWAIYLAVIAAVMVGLTERFARIDPKEDRSRTALFALSSMSMLAFMAVVLLGGLALTLAFAVMVLAAAWLGERYRLRLLDWYIQAGVLAVSYRLVVDPGVLWAFDDAALWEVLLAYLGVVGLLAAALWLKRAGRVGVVVVLESAIWTLSGILATLLLARWMDATGAEDILYVMLSFIGMVWLMLTGNQLYRLKAGGRLRRLRIILAGLYGALALVLLGVAAVLNPASFGEFKVAGWIVFGSLGAAYLLPALLFGFLAWRLAHLPRRLRVGFAVLGTGFAALLVGLEIRHFWRGADMMAYGSSSKPELYSYTVAMIVVAVLLLALAFMRQSPGLRKGALVMVALVMVKVFFVDMSGLDGLLRVVSFLVLGLVAALMAWVNRMLKMHEANT